LKTMNTEDNYNKRTKRSGFFRGDTANQGNDKKRKKRIEVSEMPISGTSGSSGTSTGVLQERVLGRGRERGGW